MLQVNTNMIFRGHNCECDVALFPFTECVFVFKNAIGMADRWGEGENPTFRDIT